MNAEFDKKATFQTDYIMSRSRADRLFNLRIEQIFDKAMKGTLKTLKISHISFWYLKTAATC